MYGKSNRGGTVNNIIASLYVQKIIEKLEKMNVTNIYTMLDYIISEDRAKYDFTEYANNDIFLNNMKRASQVYVDNLSGEYYDIIQDELFQETSLTRMKLMNICSLDKQYFLQPLIDSKLLDGINIIDVGAFTGDTVQEIVKCGIKPSKIYSFEAEPTNYSNLLINTRDVQQKNLCVCENCGVWDVETTMSLEFDNFNTRLFDSNEGTIATRKCKTITLDNYFDNIKVGFIKMDIEGAELRALKGGRNIILRDRPILAISIYHSLDDMVDIPLYLKNLLEEYDFYLRHHSYTLSEAILYALPREIGIKLEEND